MLSPFPFGREVYTDQLVDRTDEVAAVVTTILGRERLFLIGPRRFGKTSILASATEQARAAGARVIRLNAEEYVSSEALALEILKQTARLFSSPVKTVATTLQQLFRGLRPQINYDPITDGWSASISVAPDQQATAYLTEALHGLNRLGEEADAPVALIIDEFQQVVAEGGLAAERQLRAVVQTHRYVAYVFAGSDTRMLMAMTSDHGRPFYRLGSNRYVGPVPREDFRQNMLVAFSAANMTIEASAVELILDLSEDVPYNIQRLANEVWRSGRLAGKQEITEAEVRSALDAIHAVDDPQYGKTIQLLSPAQLRSLVAAVQERGLRLTSAGTARRYGLAVSTIRRALGALEDKSVLRQELTADFKPLYKCEDPFFGEWVRKRVKW